MRSRRVLISFLLTVVVLVDQSLYHLLSDLLKQRYSSVEVGGGVDLQGAVPDRVPKVGVWVPLRRFVVVAGLGLNLKLLLLQLPQPDGN
jgi:hypothetical protein